MDFGKFGYSHHVEDFLEVVREACNTNLLVVSFGIGEDLDEHCNATAVDVSILIKFQKYFLSALIVCIFVSVVQKRFREGGNITLDVQHCDWTMPLEFDYIILLHFQPYFLLYNHGSFQPGYPLRMKAYLYLLLEDHSHHVALVGHFIEFDLIHKFFYQE